MNLKVDPFYADTSIKTRMERPLTILEHFVFDRTEHHVEIVWKDGDPLFRASDIGKVLGLKKVRNTIANFDDSEKEAHTVGTPGGPQQERPDQVSKLTNSEAMV